MTSLLIFAQDPPAKGPQAEPPFFMTLPFMLAMFALLFFVVIWPAQRRQRREQEQMIANIKAGAKVVLSSGVVGRVTKVHDDGELTIQSDDSKLRVLRSAVISVRGDEQPAEAKS
jgi:preprotein translocase subunit YajC